MEYLVNGPKSASVNHDGLITGLSLGSTLVNGRVVTTDQSSGQKIVISEASVNVHVVKLESIKIQAPTQRLRVGSELPLVAVGGSDPSNQSPYAFGSAQPYINFAWSVNQAHLAALKNPFSANLVGDGNNGATMRVRGLKPGRVVVTLRAKISQSMNHPNQYQLDKDLELKDTIEIVVLDDLHVTSPSHMPENNLLLAPGSHTHLKTNKEEGNTFKLLSGTKIASVDQSGVVKAGSAAGDAVIEITNVDRSGHVQVWSPTQFYYVDFSQSRNGVEKCNTNSRFVLDGVLRPLCIACTLNGVLASV